VLRYAGVHKLTDDAAEVRGHQHSFQAFDAAGVHLLVDKSKELYEVMHRRSDVICG